LVLDTTFYMMIIKVYTPILGCPLYVCIF